MKTISRKEYQAEQLLAIAKDHKEKCNSPDCGISLIVIGGIYREIVGRELTTEEVEVFM